MPQAERELEPHRSARQFFGAELRYWRSQRNLAQTQLAAQVHVSADLIAKIEKAARWPTRGLAARCDTVLDTGGILERLWPLVDHERLGSAAPGGVLASGDHDLAAVVAAAIPDSCLDPPADTRDVWRLRLAPGNALPGATLAASILPTAGSDLRRVAVVRAAQVAGPTPRVERHLYVGEEVNEFTVRYFATDQPRSAIPRAYELDDLTLGILWVVCGTDEALLADDAALADSRTIIEPYEGLAGSAVSRDAAPGMSLVSQMWLGSEFCARYIWRSLRDQTGAALFWTREQRGEEAATWLIYQHKFEYLSRTAGRVGTGDAPPMRVFCIPDAAVTSSPRAEHSLLLLAVALMESFGIQTQVVVDPDCESVEGFVLTPDRLVVANWIRGNGLWHVDVRDPSTGEAADAAAHGKQHSIIAATGAAGRLALLAAYLGVDWPWFRRRCADLATAGVGGFIRPRSRLLGLAGLERACSFVGTLR